MPTSKDRRDRLDACVLSFVSGFVDTCIFIGLFGLFTAHITGNLALIGAAIVHSGGDVAAKMLSFPVFVLAVAATMQIAYWLKLAGWPRTGPLLGLEALLLLATIAVAMAGPLAHPDDPIPLAAGLTAAAAMGLQNALMRIELSALPSTSAMTGNVTQLVVDAVTLVARHVDASGDAKHRHDAARRISRMGPVVLAFTLGAVCGAIGYAQLRFLSLAVPAALCLGLAARFWRRG